MPITTISTVLNLIKPHISVSLRKGFKIVFKGSAYELEQMCYGETEVRSISAKEGMVELWIKN